MYKLTNNLQNNAYIHQNMTNLWPKNMFHFNCKFDKEILKTNVMLVHKNHDIWK